MSAKSAKDKLRKSQLPPLENAVKNLDEKTLQKMEKLFNSVAYLVVMEKPFTDFPYLIDLENKNGAQCGENYKNNKAARNFAMEIAATYQDDLKDLLNKAPYFSVMTDSSTDKSDLEKEIVMVRLMMNNYPKIYCMGLIDLKSAKADGILQAIDAAFAMYGFDLTYRRKLVGFGADGASVNLGCRRSVSTLLQEDCPWLVQIHCFAHRLELAVKDAFKNTYMTDVIELLTSLYQFFDNSPKRVRECQELADIMAEHFTKPLKANGTRWADHKLRALPKLKSSYQAIIIYLQHYSEDKANKADDRAKVRGYIRKLRQHKFVCYMYLCIDVFTEISSLSLLFQKVDVTVSSAVLKLQATTNYLDAYKTRESEEIGQLATDVVVDDMGEAKYGDTTLLNPLTSEQLKNQKDSVLQKLNECIEERFHNVHSDRAYTSCQIFDHRNWPSDDIAMYGTQEILHLYGRFAEILNESLLDIDKALSEWEEIKLLVQNPAKNFRGKHPLVVWKEISDDDTDRHDFDHILTIIHLTSTYPLSTAACERGFSTMKRVKSDWRASLASDTLNAIMIITDNIKKETLNDWQPTRAVTRWWSSGLKSRRANIDPPKKKD